MAEANPKSVDPIVDACLDMSYGQPEGCLFVVELSKVCPRYDNPSNVEIFNKGGGHLSVLEGHDQVIIRKLAGLDGAMIINSRGELLHSGATLTHSKNFMGHGKRHAFALGTSAFTREVVCILASEEDRHIRMFRAGCSSRRSTRRRSCPCRRGTGWPSCSPRG